MKHKHLIVPILALLLLGAACSKNTTQNTQTTNQASSGTSLANSSAANVNDTPTLGSSAGVSWSFDGTTWQSNGTPPACPTPLPIKTPVNLSLASAILYPGQIRGGNYKAHGGFIFRGKQNSDITVTAPMDAMVYNGSQYIEQGETQYLFTFIHPCGIAYRFDHLLTLSPAMQAIAEMLPAPTESSATTMLQGQSVKAGDIIGTAVGFKANNNVSVDFGLYDLRTNNGTNTSPEFGQHGLCWLNNLSTADMQVAKALPGGDAQQGKTSDYCQ